MEYYTIEVNANFVTEALQARYDKVENLWGCDASEALWDQALELVANCGMIKDVTSPSVFVDNYLINGDFVSKFDYDHWVEKTTFSEYCDQHNLNDAQILELKNSPMFAEFWAEFCENYAMLYNGEYACLSF